MRKALIAAVAIVLASMGLAGTASAQDAVIGTVTADPAQVPAPGEYTFSATGADFIPETQILLVACVSPAETLVPGESDLEAITAAATAIDALADCDIGNAQNVDVDADGAWAAELTATVGDNFFLSAGALDGSQAGATWIAIVPEDSADAAAEDEEAAAEDEADAEEAEAEGDDTSATEDEEAEADEEAAAEEEEAAAEEEDEAEAEDDSADDEAEEDAEAEDEDLADTGVETGVLAVLGVAVLGAGALTLREARRFGS